MQMCDGVRVTGERNGRCEETGGNGGEAAEMTGESNWEETKAMTGDSDCAI